MKSWNHGATQMQHRSTGFGVFERGNLVTFLKVACLISSCTVLHWWHCSLLRPNSNPRFRCTTCWPLIKRQHNIYICQHRSKNNPEGASYTSYQSRESQHVTTQPRNQLIAGRAKIWLTHRHAAQELSSKLSLESMELRGVWAMASK